jgi:hypothetical protein
MEMVRLVFAQSFHWMNWLETKFLAASAVGKVPSVWMNLCAPALSLTTWSTKPVKPLPLQAWEMPGTAVPEHL